MNVLWFEALIGCARMTARNCQIATCAVCGQGDPSRTDFHDRKHDPPIGRPFTTRNH